MTIATGTFLTYSAIGNREDLTDTIYNISPKDTPFMGSIGTATATATKHEWQTDSLAAAAANAQLEGDDFTYSTPTATTRVGNYLQISTKTCVVAKTQDAVNKAGRKQEMVYQIMKRANELKRDMEFIMLNNQTPVGSGASSTVARALTSATSWYTTNVQRGAGGASGSATTAATDGTQRPLAENLLKTALQTCWTAGGQPDLVMTGAFNKQVISTFGGNVSRIDDSSKDNTLSTAIDFYRSDYGTVKIVANRFSRDRDVHVLDTRYWATAFLRPMKTFDVAATGDATKGGVIVEYTLECRNQASSAIIADLTTS